MFETTTDDNQKKLDDILAKFKSPTRKDEVKAEFDATDADQLDEFFKKYEDFNFDKANKDDDANEADEGDEADEGKKLINTGKGDAAKRINLDKLDARELFNTYMGLNKADFDEFEKYFGYKEDCSPKDEVEVFFEVSGNSNAQKGAKIKKDDPEFGSVAKYNELVFYKIAKDVYDQRIGPMRQKFINDVGTKGGNKRITNNKTLEADAMEMVRFAKSKELITVEHPTVPGETMQIPANILLFMYSKIVGALVNVAKGRGKWKTASSIILNTDGEKNPYLKAYRVAKDHSCKPAAENILYDVFDDGLFAFLGGTPYIRAVYQGCMPQTGKYGTQGARAMNVFDDGSTGQEEGGRNILLRLVQKLENLTVTGWEDFEYDSYHVNHDGRGKAKGFHPKAVAIAKGELSRESVDTDYKLGNIPETEYQAIIADTITLKKEYSIDEGLKEHPFSLIASQVADCYNNFLSSVTKFGCNYILGVRGAPIHGKPYFPKETLDNYRQRAKESGHPDTWFITLGRGKTAVKYTIAKMEEVNKAWEDFNNNTNFRSTDSTNEDGENTFASTVGNDDIITGRGESYNDYKEEYSPEDLLDAMESIKDEFSYRTQALEKHYNTFIEKKALGDDSASILAKIYYTNLIDMRMVYYITNYPSSTVRQSLRFAVGKKLKDTKPQFIASSGFNITSKINDQLCNLFDNDLSCFNDSDDGKGFLGFGGFRHKSLRELLLVIASKPGLLFIQGGDNHGLASNSDGFVYDKFKADLNRLYMINYKKWHTIVTMAGLKMENAINTGLFNPKDVESIIVKPTLFDSDIDTKTAGFKTKTNKAADEVVDLDKNGRVDGRRVYSGINPVVPGQTYTISRNAADKFTINGNKKTLVKPDKDTLSDVSADYEKASILSSGQKYPYATDKEGNFGVNNSGKNEEGKSILVNESIEQWFLRIMKEAIEPEEK